MTSNAVRNEKGRFVAYTSEQRAEGRKASLARRKEWESGHRSEVNEKARERYRKNHARILQIKHKYRVNNRDLLVTKGKAYQGKLKEEVFNHYSKGEPKCVCCGERRTYFLSMDHISGGGRQHRKQIGSGGLLQWLRRNHFPEGFQVMCLNCNFAKHLFGSCPCQEVVDAKAL